MRRSQEFHARTWLNEAVPGQQPGRRWRSAARAADSHAHLEERWPFADIAPRRVVVRRPFPSFPASWGVRRQREGQSRTGTDAHDKQRTGSHTSSVPANFSFSSLLVGGGSLTLTDRSAGSVEIVQRHYFLAHGRTSRVGVPQLSAANGCQKFHMTVIVENRTEGCVAYLWSTLKLVPCIH